MVEPLVSIVLPTYNRARLVGFAIGSVLRQTHKNLELIVIDDNSQDATSTVVQGFQDSRVRYFRNESNLKLPRALNLGFSFASGSYLTWTSDDNLFEETAIGKMVAQLETGRCGFVFADYWDFSEIDEDSGRPLDGKWEKLPSKVALGKENRIGGCFLYTREVYEKVGEYDPDLFLVEDYDYFIRIAEKFAICHLPEPLYFFRRFDQSLFCSRFAEIKVADVLVRYKNRLLSKAGTVEALVTLIMNNAASIKNPFIRWAVQNGRRVHWRIEKVVTREAARYLANHFRETVSEALGEYDSAAKSFVQTRDALTKHTSAVANLVYRR